MKTVEQMEMEELRGELQELKLGLGGIGTKDVMRMHSIEDEIDWRQESGYADYTAQEIQDELIEKGELDTPYMEAQ
jgi:polyhydroxyalkanoate synthesis regulator phasin